ncbi:hypothetical protein JTB14_032734 [Gonioctena quinquepunctata]|nr:hypothetical protein JTB14_032734 [Gonioctena quinquepunctata]
MDVLTEMSLNSNAKCYKCNRKCVNGVKKTNNYRIIGNNTNLAVKGVPKLVTLHVYRVDKGTTVNDLHTLLQKKFREVVCEALTPKFPEMYASFKVKILEENFEKAMDPNIWPAGACVSKFFHWRPKTVTQG